MNFNVFKIAVAKQFERMQKHQLFRVNMAKVPSETNPDQLVQPSIKEALWDTYLSSFPAGTNELYRERAEHDCTCCKQFIRAVGDVVAIIDGKIESIWNVKTPSEPGYQVVADALNAFVLSNKIENVFLHYERSAGTDKNFEQLTSGVKTWEHFHVNIAAKYITKNADIPSAIAVPRVAKEVLLRALTEITDEAINTVDELIAQGTLYRGADHKFVVGEIAKLKKQFLKLKTDEEREIFAWTTQVHGAVSGIRNSSIGTLLVDLSEGKDLEDAVRAFEVVMAPSNYKRPTALVSKAQIEQAKNKITELGLTSALSRRFANIEDLTINNILFANRAAKKAINGDVFDDLAAATSSKTKVLDKIEEVSIEKFLTDILPRAESVEVLLENRHSSNLVSLIAPTDPTAGQLFKWDNKFSWSYSGNMADAIKERVKAAGGTVEGDLCCRLAWDYTDDLDFHMREPGGYEIYFSNRRSLSPCGGMLDVDANGIDGVRSDPAENIFYKDRSRMKEGIYTLLVKNFSRRSDGVGFEVEIEFDGVKSNIVYDKVMRSSEMLEVAQIKYSKANGFEIVKSMPSTQTVKNMWGLPSQSFHQVKAMMMSPNFWDEKGVGNKHFFFMLDGMTNDGTARGFFNEFLKDDMTPHRKVLEIVGGKMKVEESDNQLSGLGFSVTQKNSLVCRVKGSFTRTIKIVF